MENIRDNADGIEDEIMIPGTGLDRKTKIFRYMSIERYYELIEDRYNALSHLSLWEDPFEAFILRAGITYNDGEKRLDVYEKFKSVYGQSWTTRKSESDVIWRAMGKRGNTVRIETTVGKLIDSLGQSGARCGNIRVGKIAYKTEEEFDEKLVADNLRAVLEGDVEEVMDFFFVKRDAFAIEEEVRVIAVPEIRELNRDKCKKGHLLKFEIVPKDLIVRVLADPKMDRRDYEQLVCRTLFVDENIKVDQSRLFVWPVLADKKLAEWIDNGEDDFPNADNLRAYLVGLGKSDGNVRSILSRVRRVFRNRRNAFENITREGLEGLIVEMDQIVPNPGSANDCRTAIRHYINALYQN